MTLFILFINSTAFLHQYVITQISTSVRQTMAVAARTLRALTRRAAFHVAAMMATTEMALHAQVI